VRCSTFVSTLHSSGKFEALQVHAHMLVKQW